MNTQYNTTHLETLAEKQREELKKKREETGNNMLVLVNEGFPDYTIIDLRNFKQLSLEV